ncbi:hypothetical protein DMA11_23660 [Marinilabiliaceae bacterium JC017]|nr:hypothetical protein DMA11_23660 [Marinilabiliaceae bacterium JC017]
MARIYYTEEKLSGEPIESDFINIELFDFIFNNTDRNNFEFQSTKNSFFSGLIKTEPKAFKKVQLTRDGIYYKAKGKSFFLPSSIIFYDVFDYNFPTEFYFIAKIGNSLELRKCNGGQGIEWFQIPELHEPANDLKIWERVEKTLSELKKLAEDNLNKAINTELKQKELEETPINNKDTLSLNKDQKKGYQELMELCIKNDSCKEEINKFLENLNTEDEEIILMDLICFLEEKEYNFIMRMDWKAEIEDLEWLLYRNIENNYDLKINLPKPKSYSKEATVSFDNVFEDFDKPLRENSLQLGFIDTESDEYIVLLHKIQDKERVKQAVNKIGFDYYEK